MADTTVGIRLSLTGARQAQVGISGVNTALAGTASRLAGVTKEAGNAALGIARMAGSTTLGAVRSLATAIAGVATAATATVTAMAVSVIRTGIAYNDLEQRSRAAFTTILGSATAADKMMGDIREFGRSSPFPRQAFISATQQLLGFGYQAEQIIPLLSTINDSVAAVGGNADTIATITDVFAQIQSAGKVGTEELNRLGATGINGFQAIADATGQSIEAVRDDLSSGLVSAADGVKYLTAYMNKRFAGASANVKQTWSGAMDRIKGAWRDLGSAIVQPFVSTGGGGLAITWANQLADGLRKAANAAPLLIGLLRTGKTDGAALAGILGPEAGAKLATTMTNLRAAVLRIVSGFRALDVNMHGSSSALDLLVAGSGLLVRVVDRVVQSWLLFLRGLNDPGGVTSGANPFIQFGAALVNTITQVQDAWRLFVLGFNNAGYITDQSNSWARFGAQVSGVLDYISGAWDLITLGFQNTDAVTAQSPMWVQLGASISKTMDALRTFDWSNIIGSLSSMGGSVHDLMPAWTAFHASLPGLSTMGGLAGDVLTIVAGALRILADHVGLLVKYAPELAALFLAWQVGSRIVAAGVAITNARMILGMGVTLANMGAMRQHTAALLENAAAMRGVTVAELQAEIAGQKTLAMRIRERIATVASTIATKAWAIATRVAAVATRLLGVAMRFALGPVGLIITAVGLIATGLIYAYHHSDRFRALVDGAFKAIGDTAVRFGGWITGKALPAIQAFFTAIPLLARIIIGELVSRWRQLLDILAWPFRTAVAIVAAAITGIVTGVVSAVGWIRDHWQLVLAILTGPIGLATLFIISHWDQIKAGAAALWGRVSQLGSDLAGFAKNTLRSVVGGAIQYGIDKFNDFKAGVGFVLDKVRDAISLFQKLADKIRSLPGMGIVADGINALTSHLPGFASGGSFYAGQPMVVGERGPEVILPMANGEVIPNHRLSSLSRTDTDDLAALSNAGTGTQVIQLVVDRKVLAQTTVGGLAATQARR